YRLSAVARRPCPTAEPLDGERQDDQHEQTDCEEREKSGLPDRQEVLSPGRLATLPNLLEVELQPLALVHRSRFRQARLEALTRNRQPRQFFIDGFDGQE